MARFAARSRRGIAEERTVNDTASWFTGVQESLVTGGDASVACSVVGRRLARQGVDLGEALDGLRAAAYAVTGSDPSYKAIRSLSVAWSDEMQGHVNRVSCVDAATGLATGAHLQERVREIYSGEPPESGVGWALVLIDAESELGGRSLEAIWRIVQLAERMRWVFPGATIARLRSGRLAVLTQRAPDLGAHVGDLRGLVEDLTAAPRIWIEGLPPGVSAASALVDDLVRV